MIKSEQIIYRLNTSNWENGILSDGFKRKKADLVFAFGGTELTQKENLYQDIKNFYPQAQIILCSTAGEIFHKEVNDNTLIVTALSFEKTKIKTVCLDASVTESSFEIGKKVIKDLDLEGLKHVFIVSSGMKINGGHLVSGLKDSLPSYVSVTGGLAGDGHNFNKTTTGLNTPAKENQVILVGFYGENIKIGCGSMGGWDSFGVKRLVTKSKDNIVYEFDGEPALPLYKKYLGKDLAKDLPTSGLFFPLSVKEPNKNVSLVRTLLAVSEEDQSLIFAGNLLENSEAQLMKANIERLISGAEEAAEQTESESPQLAILVSCVGRKFVLKQRIEEEIERVGDVLGNQCLLAGFYSYGEISPTINKEEQCELHNQTMTVTTFQE